MIGTRLGQYRIDALLGQGGMGAVYLATDEMLGRQVAIKVLRDDVDTQGTATERFRSEAQILARLDHPHILRLYGFSQHDGVLYMVTEFVRGEALLRRLEHGTTLDTPQVLEWAGQVLDALGYAHELGVVHRDIKPANILIDERHRARLLDFGIARIVGTEGPTQTGHAVGTLTYMAPEQVLDEPVDGRADIYAFAVVLCQMLAGRRPYRSTTTAGLIREIVDGPPPDIAVLLPPQTAMFAPALTRALARQPADRTPTAGRLRQELMAAVTAPQPPLPSPPSDPRALATIAGTFVETAAPDRMASASGAVSAVTARPLTDPDRTVPGPPPVARPRRPTALAWLVPAFLLVAAGGAGWYALAPSRQVSPRVTVAPEQQPGQPAAVVAPPRTAADTVPDVPARGRAAPRAGTGVPAPAPPAPRREAPTPPASSPASSPAPAAESAAEPAAEPAAAPADDQRTAAVAPESETDRPAGRASVVFTNLILMDRVDDEDEEIDVSMRLDGRRVVLLDEDEVARRSIAYESIDRATYNTRKPGRFSLRRGPSHWLTLETGIAPVVVRLGPRNYDGILAALQDRGVRVERLP